MAGVGQSDLPVVSAGAQATPLVTPADPNTLNSSAVSNLVDAFRQGFITQDDIVNRVGDIGQAKNRALLEQLGEYVSPDAIKARHNELTLSDPATEAKRWELERSKWNSVFNGGVDAFQQYGPWFGHSAVPTKADGTPDFQSMGKLGQTFRAPVYMAELAQQGLTPDPARTQETQDASGKKGKKTFNKFGVDITAGSPGESYYRSLMGMFPGRTPPGETPDPTANPAKAVPVPGHGDVSPSGAPVGSYDPQLGAVTKPGLDVGEARSQILDKNQSFKIWEGNKSNIDAFHNIVNTIEETKDSKDPESVQRRLEAERGLVYTLSELQQNQAQGAIPRSVITDWEHIVANPNLLDKVKSIIGKTTGNNPLTDNQVESLVSLGKSQIAGKASAAISGLKLTKKLNPAALTDDEEALLNTGGISEVNGNRAAELRQLQQRAVSGKSGATIPTKTISSAAPVPKDNVIVTKEGRLKSLGAGTFLPLSK